MTVKAIDAFLHGNIAAPTQGVPDQYKEADSLCAHLIQAPGQSFEPIQQ